MTPVFDAYAGYYDLLYRDKDYAAEAAHVARLLEQHAPGFASVLELGCGTGGHAVHLVRAGREVHGVDRSGRMLDRARARPLGGGRLDLTEGDIRSVRLDRTFDVAVSLFHVVSYQPTESDLLAVLATARAHLEPGGVFLFDAWYGPAVLTDRPVVRVKRLADESIEVTRIAEPTLHPDRNLVDVDYEVHVRELATGAVQVLRERHTMRYLFGPEVASAAARSGFEVVRAAESMTGRPPGFDTWAVDFVCRATG